MAEQHSDIARALDRVSWQSIHQLPDTSSGQRLLLHRIKGQRLGRWDRKHKKMGCPHCPHSGSTGGTMVHIMWECASAQRLWAILLGHWQEFGCWRSIASPSDSAFRDAVFSLTLPSVPTRVWSLPALAKISPTDHRAVAEVYPTMNCVWQQHVLVTFQGIQQWRLGLHEPETAWSPREATTRLAARLRGSLRQLLHSYSDRLPPPHPGAALLGELYGRCLEPEGPQQATEDGRRGRYLLFFDGGSRGNPGPGGAGAVIVATDEAGCNPTIAWSASISMANAYTTNNQAEYNGVICGLRAAHSAGWTGLEVVGDSMLILRQLSLHRPPRSARLRPLYSIATRLADALGVKHWHHHLRTFNKMADGLANVAMDTRTSIQVYHPTQRVEHSGLHDHLMRDFSHWQESALSR